MIRKGPKQPTATRETRGDTTYHPPQEMDDPWGHLSEAMKKKIFGDAGPPAPEPPPTQPKPTESRPDPC